MTKNSLEQCTQNISNGNTGITNIVVGLLYTKLANLANTKVKREVQYILAVFINFSPLPVQECITPPETQTQANTNQRIQAA